MIAVIKIRHFFLSGETIFLLRIFFCLSGNPIERNVSVICALDFQRCDQSFFGTVRLWPHTVPLAVNRFYGGLPRNFIQSTIKLFLAQFLRRPDQFRIDLNISRNVAENIVGP